MALMPAALRAVILGAFREQLSIHFGFHGAGDGRGDTLSSMGGVWARGWHYRTSTGSSKEKEMCGLIALHPDIELHTFW